MNPIVKTFRVQAAQGDLLFTKVARAPRGVTPVTPVNGRYVLALGEATGHHHSIAVEDLPGRVDQAPNGTIYLTLDELMAGAVQHQEHGGVQAVEPGIYEVRRQREWTDTDEPRQVAD